jgi:hypothetical protein
MKGFCVAAVLQSQTHITRQEEMTPMTEAELFRLRDRALRRQQPGMITGFLKSLIPAPLAVWIASYRGKQSRKALINSLEALPDDLLDDLGVVKKGPCDYIVRTGEMPLLSALNATEEVLGGGSQKRLRAPSGALRQGERRSRSARGQLSI